MSSQKQSFEGAKVWREEGYQDFADGTFGNGGQNIYCSRDKGILQRIRRFDFNNDGYMDLFFVNAQDMNERPPSGVYRDPLGKAELTELTSLGGYAGAVGDLNGDGYDEFVLVNQCNGTHSDMTAFVYYGCPEGLSERYKIDLPVPDGRAAAIGDFKGTGKPAIAFSSNGRLMVFYQNERGFDATQHVDLTLEITHMTAADIDGDGYADLFLRVKGSKPMVLWGGPDGFDLERCSFVGGDDPGTGEAPSSTQWWIMFVEGWAPRILDANGSKLLFREEEGKAVFYKLGEDRQFVRAFELDPPNPIAAAVGDINGNGSADLVVVCCKNRDEIEDSFIYWGEDGKPWSDDRKTAIKTISARDVLIADLNGNGFGDVAVCQGRTDVLNTFESVIYKGCANGVESEPVRLVSHDAGAIFAGRTCDDPNPQILLVNHTGGRVRGDVKAFLYWGGPDGFKPDRRAELPTWAAPDAMGVDFNDDGWADIFVGNCAENAPHLDPGSFIYWNGPNGFDPDNKLVLPTRRTHGSAVGDFRHSGYLDIAAAGFQNPVLLIFRGGPDGYDLENPQKLILDPDIKDLDFTPPHEPRGYDTPDGQKYWEPRGVVAADFNQNGWLDLFIAQIYGPRSLILWGGPDGFSMERSTWLSIEGADRAQVADLNGNGYPDLIICSYQSLSNSQPKDSYLYIYWGGPDGYREDRKSMLPNHSGGDITIADFNNDGNLDIFVAVYNGGRDRDVDCYIYWGSPGGHYSVENRTRLFGHSACGCIAGDFNHDGYIDLAVAHHKTYGNHSGESKVWWNGPEGFLPNHTTKLPTDGPHGMFAVDAGNAMDRSPEEHYISNAKQLPDGSRILGIDWEAEIQARTWVRAQFRVAASEAELESAPWQGPDGSKCSWFEKGDGAGAGFLQAGQWIQYRLALGATNGGNTPRLTSVSVYHGC